MTAARTQRHPGTPLANGSTFRPEFRPYRWREPSSPYRQELAAAILAETGDEEDAWDSPPPLVNRRMGPQYLKPCGTPAAYRRHTRWGEEPCDECRRAASEAKARKGSTRKRPADIAERLELLATMRLHKGYAKTALPGEVTVAEAAERLGVDQRTVLRYAERLREAS